MNEFEQRSARLLAFERGLARLGALYKMSMLSGPLGIEPELVRVWIEWCADAEWCVGWMSQRKGGSGSARASRAVGWAEYWAGRAATINDYLTRGSLERCIILGEPFLREMMMYRRSVGAALRLWAARGREREVKTTEEALMMAAGCERCAEALVAEGELPTYCVMCGAVR
jgi:hypothetical protein